MDTAALYLIGLIAGIGIAGGFVWWLLRVQRRMRAPDTSSVIRHSAPRRQLATTTRPARARPAIDYAAERRLITLALAGDMAPGAVWPLLRGSPSARRRRVLKVARELARPAVVAGPQKVEVVVA